MGNFITWERVFMEIQQGYSYHIKDEFFDLIQDKYLMSNKEQRYLISLLIRYLPKLELSIWSLNCGMNMIRVK